MRGYRYQLSGPAVVMSVTLTVLSAVASIVRWVVWPLARWWWRLLRRAWHDHQHRRTLARAHRQLALPRRQRRRLTNGHYHTNVSDPELALRALWWCVWVLAHEVPPVRLAEQMRATDRAWADAVGFVAAQCYTIPTRHPQEITAAAWATELRALHGVESLLPAVRAGRDRWVA